MGKLAGLRVSEGLSQKEVAKFLNVSQGTISVWERGICIPTYIADYILAPFSSSDRFSLSGYGDILDVKNKAAEQNPNS